MFEEPTCPRALALDSACSSKSKIIESKIVEIKDHRIEDHWLWLSGI
jgi:hypothetical protein